MRPKRHITLTVGIAALMLGAGSALAKPPEVTARRDPALGQAATFFKESERTTPDVSAALQGAGPRGWHPFAASYYKPQDDGERPGIDLEWAQLGVGLGLGLLLTVGSFLAVRMTRTRRLFH